MGPCPRLAAPRAVSNPGGGRRAESIDLRLPAGVGNDKGNILRIPDGRLQDRVKRACSWHRRPVVMMIPVWSRTLSAQRSVPQSQGRGAPDPAVRPGTGSVEKLPERSHHVGNDRLAVGYRPAPGPMRWDAPVVGLNFDALLAPFTLPKIPVVGHTQGC